MTNPPKFIKSKTELPKGTDQAHVKQIIALQKKWGYVLESNGVANIAAAFSGAFPVGGSFSRSSLNKLAGASSAWAGAITWGEVRLAARTSARERFANL